MNFTVVINNRDRLSTTKKLVEDLLERNTKSIWIIDNDSGYPPLLDWYNLISNEVRIIRQHNAGHSALFSTGIIKEIKEDWCFYTDSDIELNPKMPHDYQEQMLNLALKYNIEKIGLAININDIPDHYKFKRQVVVNEKRWWENKVEDDVYAADTDTTFCLTKKADQFKSLRIAGDFTCRHIPWYVDLKNLTEEEEYYITHTDLSRVTQYTKQHKEYYEKG